jgi:hypothetical protein
VKEGEAPDDLRKEEEATDCGNDRGGKKISTMGTEMRRSWLAGGRMTNCWRGLTMARAVGE